MEAHGETAMVAALYHNILYYTQLYTVLSYRHHKFIILIAIVNIHSSYCKLKVSLMINFIILLIVFQLFVSKLNTK